VRFYGTIDQGFGYQTNGVALDDHLGANFSFRKPGFGPQVKILLGQNHNSTLLWSNTQ
jgi:hypothetical protein